MQRQVVGNDEKKFNAKFKDRGEYSHFREDGWDRPPRGPDVWAALSRFHEALQLKISILFCLFVFISISHFLCQDTSSQHHSRYWFCCCCSCLHLYIPSLSFWYGMLNFFLNILISSSRTHFLFFSFFKEHEWGRIVHPCAHSCPWWIRFLLNIIFLMAFSWPYPSF